MSIEFLFPQNTTDTPESKCTRCLQRIAAVSSMEDPEARPKAGDPTVCAYCGHIMVFRADMTLRDPTPSEMSAMRRTPEWPELAKLQAKFRKHMMAGGEVRAFRPRP